MFEMNRREFAKSAIGLFGWGMFAGGLGGCSLLSGGSGPRLTLGIISDIHIRLVRKDGKDFFEGEDRFRDALTWFRDHEVDGVTISGDLADHGLIEELEAVGRIWNTVFPNDKAPDGRHVERLFVYGNHDWEGFRYGNAGKKMFGDDLEPHTIRKDLAAAWKKAFNEEYSPVWRKEVRGFTFVGAHWTADRCRAYEEIGVPQTAEWFKENGGTIDPSKPFFYLQHPPPKNTCHGPTLWGHDDGSLTAVLSQYPNAISLTGHSHASLTSDKAIWQGEFTAIDVSSLSYTGLSFGDLDPLSRENDSNEGKLAGTNAKKIMRRMSTGDGHQGMLATVFDDRVVFERRDFVSGEKLGDNWVVPLPAKKPMPFAFEPRAAVSVAPEFPAGATLAARMTTGKNRGGGSVKSEERRVLEVTIPAANRTGAGRVFDYAVEISGRDGGTDRKYLFAHGFYRSPETKEANTPTVLQVDAGLLEAKGEWLIKAIPRNCFGVAGSAIGMTFSPAID
ncbi:MAG: metallophosphoesterase [Kiritimatiellae bacterium]|nr:metallophosphoesterase [Kiritimatiellia bacterium]